MPASPILLLVPYRNKAAVLYSQIPTSASASGDMVVSRAGVSTRVNAQGNIESVAANVPRLNYPLGGVANGCPALLVEPTAQNLVPSGTAYTASTGVQTSGVTDSPAVAISGTLVTKNEASGTIRYSGQNFSATALASGATYTVSRFFKYNGVAFTTSLEHNNALQWGNVGWIQPIVLSAASGVTLGASTLCTGSIENFGNGWYRVNVRVTTGATVSGAATVAVLSILPAALSTGQGFLTACPQLETGSVATSYVPTTTGTVTRNADIVTNNTFVIPNLIGAILTEFDSPTSGTYFLDNIPIPIASGSNKIAISYTPTTLTIYRNGAQVSGSPVTPPGGTAPVIGNVINIGHNNQLYQLGSGIKSFVLYSSTLSAAEASGLTT